jgi:hypothetical protein
MDASTGSGVNMESYARGYFAGLMAMRHRAGVIVDAMAGSTVRDAVRQIAVHEPLPNAKGEYLLFARERGSAEIPCPPDPARAFLCAWAWCGPHDFGETTTSLTVPELDARFPGWHRLAAFVSGRPIVTGPSHNSSEAPEPPAGFVASSEAQLWGVMAAAGYDLPTPEPIKGRGDDRGRLARVLSGPFKNRVVGVLERSGPWGACELGTESESDPPRYVAVRLCDLKFWRYVYALGPGGIEPLNPPDVPPVYDRHGQLVQGACAAV